MKKLLLMLCIAATHAHAQNLSFSERTDLLNPITGFAGFADCVVDMNNDFLDDIVRVGEKGVFIDYQLPDGSFVQEQFNFSVQSAPSWSICAGDLNNDGYNDLLFADSETVSFVIADDHGRAYHELLMPVFIECQRSTMADINNDGWLDAFVCNESDISIPFRNDGEGEMIPDSALIPTVDLPGNYSAIWTDYDDDRDIDLYITKCLAGALPGDPVRTNALYRNNNDGTYTEVGAQSGTDDKAQSWSTAFEDFDHDGDYDAFIVNHDFANRLLRNNGDGTFTDVIGSSGIDPFNLVAFECASGDFNNDGHIDIFSDLDANFYLGNGDLTFSAEDEDFIPGGIGDLNNDGFLDVFNNGHLYINEGNENHWVKFNTLGILSNANGIGARIEIYGEWGLQSREVRSGQSYSPMNSLTTHFGTGVYDFIDSLIIYWPSGIISRMYGLPVDSTYQIPEASCFANAIHLDVNGIISLCEGESISIPGPKGFAAYSWSNGDTTKFTSLTSPGRYHLIATDSSGCVALSQQIEVQQLVEIQPKIEPQASVRLCKGDTLVLMSSPGENYRWSTGEIQVQSIRVYTSGFYTVAVDALCFDGQISSAPLEVIVLDADEPVAQSVYVLPGDDVLLTASGENIHWYNQSGLLLSTGSTFQTPSLDTTTFYYIESHVIYPDEQQEGGKPDHSGPGGLSGQSGSLLFSNWEPFTLDSVSVYIPAGAPLGIRFVQLLTNDTVVAFRSFTVDTGINVLPLGFDVPVGEHELISLQGNMFRNAGNLSYPYPIGDVGEITGSSHGNEYYYYFYDWKITRPSITCISERVPFEVIVSSVDNQHERQYFVYPNPVYDMIDIRADENILSLVFYNSLGMISKTINGIGESDVRLDMSDLIPGLYIVQIQFEDSNAVTKILKLE